MTTTQLQYLNTMFGCNEDFVFENGDASGALEVTRLVLAAVSCTEETNKLAVTGQHGNAIVDSF